MNHQDFWNDNELAQKVLQENKGLKEFLCSKTGGVVLTLIVYAVTLIVMCVIGALSDSIGDSPVVGVVGLILLAVWTILGSILLRW